MESLHTLDAQIPYRALVLMCETRSFEELVRIVGPHVNVLTYAPGYSRYRGGDLEAQGQLTGTARECAHFIHA